METPKRNRTHIPETSISPKNQDRKGKLAHYISAGGMKQTRRTLSDDIRETRQKVFLLILAVLSLIWLFFYFVPCL